MVEALFVIVLFKILLLWTKLNWKLLALYFFPPCFYFSRPNTDGWFCFLLLILQVKDAFKNSKKNIKKRKLSDGATSSSKKLKRDKNSENKSAKRKSKKKSSRYTPRIFISPPPWSGLFSTHLPPYVQSFCCLSKIAK